MTVNIFTLKFLHQLYKNVSIAIWKYIDMKVYIYHNIWIGMKLGSEKDKDIWYWKF